MRFDNFLWVTTGIFTAFLVLEAAAFSSKNNAHGPRKPVSNRRNAKNKSNYKVWRELADPGVHRDFMFHRVNGGWPVESSRNNLQPHFVYHARVDSKFCLVMNGISQVYQARAYFGQPLPYPSSRRARYRIEESFHEGGPWYAKLPGGIDKTKRKHILELLDTLIAQYGDDADFVYTKRHTVNEAFHNRTAWIKNTDVQRQAYRQKLKEILKHLEQDNDALESVVWHAIGRQAMNLPAGSALPNIPDTISGRLRLAEKVLNKVPSLLHEELSTVGQRSDTTNESEARPLSAHRRKRRDRQKERYLADLNEVGGGMQPFVRVLEDTITTMDNHRRENKGSSSQEFQSLLLEIKTYHTKLTRAARDVGKFHFRLEYGFSL